MTRISSNTSDWSLRSTPTALMTNGRDSYFNPVAPAGPTFHCVDIATKVFTLARQQGHISTGGPLASSTVNPNAAASNALGPGV